MTKVRNIDITRIDSTDPHWPPPPWHRKRDNTPRWIGLGVLVLVFLLGALSYLRQRNDPIQYIRDQCLSHHGVPVDDKAADGRVLAIRCDLFRSLP